MMSGSEVIKLLIILFAFGLVSPVAGIIAHFIPKLRYVWFGGMMLGTGKFIALHLAPLPDWTGTARGFAFTAADFFALALLVSLIAIPRFKFTWFPRGSFFYLLYFVGSCLSFAVTQHAMQGGFEVLKMIWMYVYFLAAYNFFKYEQNFWPLIYGVLGLTYMMFLVGLYQRYFGWYFQIPSTLPHQNSLALFMEITTCLLLGVLLEEKLSRLLYFLVLIATGMGALLMYFTLSRGGLMMLIFGAAVIIFFSVVLKGFNSKKFALLSFIGLAGLIVAAIALPRIINRFENAPEASKMTRVYLARAAVRMADSHPLGVGLNTFAIYSGPEYPYAHEMYDERLSFHKEGQGAVVETAYLLVAAECGWSVLILMLLWYLVYYYFLLHCVFSYRKQPCFGIVIGLLGGLSANYAQTTLEWVLKQYCNFYLLMLVFAVTALLFEFRPKKQKGGKIAA